MLAINRLPLGLSILRHLHRHERRCNFSVSKVVAVLDKRTQNLMSSAGYVLPNRRYPACWCRDQLLPQLASSTPYRKSFTDEQHTVGGSGQAKEQQAQSDNTAAHFHHGRKATARRTRRVSSVSCCNVRSGADLAQSSRFVRLRIVGSRQSQSDHINQSDPRSRSWTGFSW